MLNIELLTNKKLIFGYQGQVTLSVFFFKKFHIEKLASLILMKKPIKKLWIRMEFWIW